jgi:hypothetical protein
MAKFLRLPDPVVDPFQYYSKELRSRSVFVRSGGWTVHEPARLRIFNQEHVTRKLDAWISAKLDAWILR